MKSISGRVGKIEAARRDRRVQQEFKSYRLMQIKGFSSDNEEGMENLGIVVRRGGAGCGAFRR